MSKRVRAIMLTVCLQFLSPNSGALRLIYDLSAETWGEFKLGVLLSSLVVVPWILDKSDGDRLAGNRSIMQEDLCKAAERSIN